MWRFLVIALLSGWGGAQSKPCAVAQASLEVAQAAINYMCMPADAGVSDE